MTDPISLSKRSRVDLERLKDLLGKATPAPWEDDHEKNEGSYGEGWNVHEGYNSAVILGPDGKRLFDALNSDAAYIHEDRGGDEHGEWCTAWDETSIRNAELIVALRNAADDLLAAEARTQAAEQRVRELEAGLGPLIRHFEYGDQHDEGAFDDGCPECIVLADARALLASQAEPERSQDQGGDKS